MIPVEGKVGPVHFTFAVTDWRWCIVGFSWPDIGLQFFLGPFTVLIAWKKCPGLPPEMMWCKQCNGNGYHKRSDAAPLPQEKQDAT